MTPVAAARAGRLREIVVGARSRGEGSVGKPDHPRLTYRPELDAIRGLAILLVLIDHVRMPGLERGGFVGVTLFFVLSGYLITSLLLTERDATGRIDLRAFWERRARRLLPALVIVVAVVGLILVAQGRATEFPGPAIVVLFYVSNWAGILGMDRPYLGHAWTLSVEEQFYIAWPLLFIVTARRYLPLVLVAGIAGSIALRFWVGDTPRLEGGTDTRADALLMGCLLAISGVRLPRWAGWIAAAAMLGLLLGPPIYYPLALTITAVAATVAIASWTFAWKPLVALGTISYGLYLWHAVIFTPFEDQLRGSAGPVVQLGLQLGLSVLSVAVAVLSARYIERPFRLRQAPIFLVSVVNTRTKSTEASSSRASVSTP